MSQARVNYNYIQFFQLLDSFVPYSAFTEMTQAWVNSIYIKLFHDCADNKQRITAAPYP